MARLQDFPSVTPTSSDKILIVQSQGQGLAPYSIKMDSVNPTGTGALSLNRKSGSTVGAYSVAEGLSNTASGNSSHAEGYNNTASGNFSHVEGSGNTASADQSHAEGYTTTASGSVSHAEGVGTIANHSSQHVFGQYNVADTSTAAATLKGNYIEIVGKGTNDANRSNARTLDWSGNEVLAGDLTINGSTSVGARLSQLKQTKTQLVSSQAIATNGEYSITNYNNYDALFVKISCDNNNGTTIFIPKIMYSTAIPFSLYSKNAGDFSDTGYYVRAHGNVYNGKVSTTYVKVAGWSSAKLDVWGINFGIGT